MSMKPKTVLAACLAASAVVAGVASAQALFKAEETIVANEGKIGSRWKLAEGATLATPAYPAQFATRGDHVCLAMGYMINPDGSTSDFAVLRQWNSSSGKDEPVEGYWQSFAQSGADALSQWRFQPREDAGAVRPTYTVATLAFTGTQAAPADIRGQCRITDLAATVQERKSEAYLRRSRDRAALDRANQAAGARGAMNENPGRR